MNQISIKELYQTKFKGDKTKNYQIFGVTIGNAKMTRKVQFHTEAPLIIYHQNLSNSCCLSSLASDFHGYGEKRAVSAHVNCIEESLNLQKTKFKNRINFSNYVMKNIRGKKLNRT